MKLNKGILPILLAVTMIWSCGRQKGPVRDTPTTGNIHIAADEVYRNLTENELMVFHSIYDKAKITVDYVSEAEAVQQLLSDSARAILIGRKLSAPDEESLTENQYKLKYTRLAKDAIAVIVHPSNKTDLLDMDQVRNMLKGTMTKWKDGKEIRIVFDHAGSGVYAYLRDSVVRSAERGKNIFALQSSKEVIDYVATNVNSVGFIGVNLISGFDSSAQQQFDKKVKTLAISRTLNDEAYEPYQAYIAQNLYPMTRDIYLVINEPFNGLGSGLGAFMGPDSGQRIILKDGLVPANAPIRLIQVNPSSGITN